MFSKLFTNRILRNLNSEHLSLAYSFQLNKTKLHLSRCTLTCLWIHRNRKKALWKLQWSYFKTVTKTFYLRGSPALLPSNKICLILGSSSFSPQHSRRQIEALGWGTKTLIFFQDSSTFSLRSPTLVTFAITSVPGPSYFVLKTKLFPLVDNPGIAEIVSRLSWVSSWFISVGLPVSSILFAASFALTLSMWFTAHGKIRLIRFTAHGKIRFCFIVSCRESKNILRLSS